MLLILVLFSFLLVSSSHAGFLDFCVANLKAPQTPSGYPCKPTAELTSDDFVHSGMNVPGISLHNNSVRTALVDHFPALNGRGLALLRLDLSPGSVIPIHTHPAASETFIVLKGSVTAGFISSDNIVYMKTLKEGDLIVFPQGLLHFYMNTGETLALAKGIFSSSDPGRQGLSDALFSSNLPSEYISKITLIDVNEVRRLKALFGGSG